MKPTLRQKVLLDFISDFIQKHGYSPSYREICDGLGYTSTGTVALHIDALIDRNLLRKKYTYGRSLEVIGADERLLEETLLKHYAKLSQQEKQIVVHALDLLGFTSLTKRLK